MPELIEIRTYRFQHGALHLERGIAESMTDAEVAEEYPDKGPLLEVQDGEMDEKTFFGLEDFRDL